jgi:hypothetical protein
MYRQLPVYNNNNNNNIMYVGTIINYTQATCLEQFRNA